MLREFQVNTYALRVSYDELSLRIDRQRDEYGEEFLVVTIQVEQGFSLQTTEAKRTAILRLQADFPSAC